MDQIGDMASFASELVPVDGGEGAIVLKELLLQGDDVLRQMRGNLEERGPLCLLAVDCDFALIEATPFDHEHEAASRCVEPREGVANRLNEQQPGFSELFLERPSSL
ncbi:MAG TPA: hypothetical protein VGS07_21380 [Thermoanaerobaculia bacterium]|nr:hypothetical protein [Thermoanaerobaculia bacterium]